LAEEDLDERWRDLCFLYGKWDVHVAGRQTFPPGCLVLSRSEHEEAVRVAEGLAQACAAARATFRRDASHDAWLGIPATVAAAARASPTGPGITRIDLFLTRDGWRASECNDDVPGGHNEAIGLPALFADALPDGTHVPGDLPDALLGLLRPKQGAVGLVHATAYSDDRQVMQLVAKLLAAEGIPSVLASPAHLEFDGRARLLGTEVECIYRFFPAEWLPLVPTWRTWQDALAAGLPMVNDLSWAFTQSKAAFARLPPGEGIPRTGGMEMYDEAMRTPERFVLKPAYGRVGEGVVMGAETPPETWRKRLGQARRSRQGGFVLQERFHPTTVEVAPGDPRTVCLGAYVVAGRFAGYYTRIADGPLVAYDAANILAVVEDA
jgi:hypothetical protein